MHIQIVRASDPKAGGPSTYADQLPAVGDHVHADKSIGGLVRRRTWFFHVDAGLHYVRLEVE